MTSITDQLQQVVKGEELKNAKDVNFNELQKTIEEIEKLGLGKKSDYSLPLIDTLGRTCYTSLNKRISPK